MRSPLDLYRDTRLLATNTKALEAQVFRRVLYQLEQAETELEQTKALADLRVLWMTVDGLVADPENHLPPALQSNLIELSQAIMAELELPREQQDKAWMIELTTVIADGLEGHYS